MTDAAPAAAPRALVRLARAAAAEPASRFSAVPPPDPAGRQHGVLVLFGPAGGTCGGSADLDLLDLDLLVTERAATLRAHAGQPAFPGGRVDPGDDGPIGAALREAEEETGLVTSGVEVLTTLPRLGIMPSFTSVVPALAWWHTSSDVAVVDPGEVARVLRAPVRALLDPACRVRVRHPRGYVGHGFDIDGLVIWGFTGGVVEGLLEVAEGLGLVPPAPWSDREVRLDRR